MVPHELGMLSQLVGEKLAGRTGGSVSLAVGMSYVFYKPLDNRNSIFNMILFSALISASWGYLLYTGNVSTIWPLFGCANQTLAAIAFAIGTTIILNMGKVKYALITFIPMVCISIITVTAALENIFQNYIPKHLTILATLSSIILLLLLIILFECSKVWIVKLREFDDKKKKKSAV